MIKKKEIIPPKGLTADLINKYSIFNGTKYFSTSGLQNYLVFDLIKRNKVHIKFSTVVKISWESTGLSWEKIINTNLHKIISIQIGA